MVGLLIPLFVAVIFLLIWAIRKIVGEIRRSEPPSLKYGMLLMIALILLNVSLFPVVILITMLSHSACAEARLVYLWVLSFVASVMLPCSVLWLYRYHRLGKDVRLAGVAIGMAMAAAVLFAFGKLSFWPPLMFAVRNGHATTASFLMDLGADARKTDLCGRAPLPYAATKRDAAMVRLLVDKGADVNSRDSRGSTALVWTVMNGDRELTEYLLEKGAKVDGASPNYLPLRDAVHRGRKDLVQLLLDRGADINAVNFQGCALSAAVVTRNKDMAQMLLDRGASPNLKSASSTTPLMEAARYGNTDMVRLLLARGADPGMKDYAGKTALATAEENKHSEAAEVIRNHPQTIPDQRK